MISGISALVSELITAIPAILQVIVPVLFSSVSEILSTVAGMLTGRGAVDALTGVFSAGFVDSMKEWIPYLADISALFAKDTVSTFAGKLGNLKGVFVSLYQAAQPFAEALITDFIRGIDTLLVIWDEVLLPALSLGIDIFTQLATTIFNSITPAIQRISDTFDDLSQHVSAVIQGYIIPLISSFIQMIRELWEENQDKLTLIGELFSTVFNTIAAAIAWYVDVFKKYIHPFFSWFTSTVQENMGVIKNIFQAAFDFISGIIQLFTAIFQGDWSGMWEAVKTILSAAWSFIINIFTLIENFMDSVGSAIHSILVNAFENIRMAIVAKLTASKESIINIFNVVRTFISSIGMTIWSIITNTFENIRVSIVNKLNAAKDNVFSIFTAIRDEINNKIEDAKNIVAAGVEKLKDLFNFEWELPKIKLPHFKISGKFSLDPPSVPSFGIEWYKKGGVMLEPTAFGINPASGNMMVGGEAGKEAIAPIETLKQYVGEAVAGQNAELIAVLNLILEAIYALDEGLGEKLFNALLNMKFQVNEREFARLVKAV